MVLGKQIPHMMFYHGIRKPDATGFIFHQILLARPEFIAFESALKYRERYLWGLRTLLSKVSLTVAMTTEIVYLGLFIKDLIGKAHTHTISLDSALHSGFPTPSPYLSGSCFLILDELSVQTKEPGGLYLGLSCS